MADPSGTSIDETSPRDAGAQACALRDRVRSAISASQRHSGRSRQRAEAVAATSAEIVAESHGFRDTLRSSLEAYVTHIRADGVAPERMLVMVKTAVQEATPPGLAPHDARALMEDAVRWSVETYYDVA